MNYKAKIIKFTETTVKLVIVLLGIWILYKKLIHNQNITVLWQDISISFKEKKQFNLMIIAVALMPLNQYLESLKWKIQVKPIENISYYKSFLSIFTGISAGMFFPNRMGNFLGRIFMLEKGDRIKAAMLTLVGGMAQMIATVGIGLLATLFFIEKHIVIISIGIIILISTLTLLYFNIHLLKYVQFLIPKRFKEKTQSYVEIFSKYKRKELFMILILSFLRYFLYTFQFILLLWAFNFPLSYFKTLIPIALTYLMMMIIPFITIMEIAVRGSVSILVFEKWLLINGINISYNNIVFSASSLLWIINIAIPALIGLFLTHKLKFFREKNES
ncbi:MAG: hypothetical protein E7066_06825 [Lentimicrobiaceae bacterium]|nr:hypothetical protein [Lentimicrobiaceae bacterium]